MKPKDDNKTYTPGKKVFDVARPGKTPAAPGARPVITNRKTVDDPDVSVKHSLMNPKQKITIRPTSGKAADAKTETKSQSKEPTGPPPVKDQSDSSVKVSINPKSPTPAEPKSAHAELPKAAIIDQIGKTAADDANVTVQEPTETTDKPSTESTYAASTPSEPESSSPERTEPMHMGMPQEFSNAVVSQHGKRRTLGLEILAVLIILVLLAAIANLLVDAEIIKTNFDLPHTNFFDAV